MMMLASALPRPRHFQPPPAPPREAPSNVAAEAQLLAALADAPTVTRAFLLPEEEGAGGGEEEGERATSGGGAATLVVEWAQRDLPANRPRRFLRSHALVRDRAARRALLSGGLQATALAGDVVLSSPSPSGKRQLVVRSTPATANGGGSNKPPPPSVSIEVWGEGRCLLDLSVPAELHGAVYSGAWFGDGGPSWSRDEERVAYVAERPERETTPEWGREDFLFSSSSAAAAAAAVAASGSAVAGDGSDGRSGAAAAPEQQNISCSNKHAPLPKAWRGLGAKVEDWGEQLTGRARPGVFVLDVPSAAVLAVAEPPPPPPISKAAAGKGDGEIDDDEDSEYSSSQGQPALSPCGRAVVFVSWPHRDENLYPGLGKQRLGMVYCTNRPCSLWLARLPEVGAGGAGGAGGEDEQEEGKAPQPLPPPPPPAPRCLTPTLLSSMSPRFSPRGDKLAFLSHDAAVSSGAHFATAALLSLDFDPEAAEPVCLSSSSSSSGTAAAAAAATAAVLPRVVVPVVARPRSADHFPGIYAASLPDRPYVTGSVLALTSQWGSSAEVLLVDLVSGEVACASRAGPAAESGGGTRRKRRTSADDGGGDSSSSFEGSWAFLAALPPSSSSASNNDNSGGGGGGGWLAAVVSSPTCPPDVVVADFSSAAAAAEAAAAAGGGGAAGASAAASAGAGVAGVAAVAARLRWRRAARADGSPPPLRAPAAAAMARVTTRVIEVAVPAAGPRPRPRGEEEAEEGEEGDEREKEVDNVIEVIVVSPSSSSKNSSSSGASLPPALVVPHGGPHSAHADGWALPTSFLAACGFCVLLVNFRGSTGYGENNLQLLPGRIGSLDVDDCVAALKAASDLGLADASRAAAVGGSHGGFLAANLLGMHPGLFRAGVLRNPVLDLSLMAAVSDIPEWAFVEAWGGETGRRRARARPAPEDLERFAAVSPIAHVDRVTAPLLVLLGGRDRRVPLEDASRYLCALRGRRRAGAGAQQQEKGREGGSTTEAPPPPPPPPPRTRVLVFPNDAHALDAPQTEFEAWLNAAAWLKEHVV